ncbi:MAG: hypothetical protein WCY51_00425 [Sulfurimonas sp.]|uniref:hypothetical protein n=1 Tax=Sulfurimonas sp. TaxID=2022749 RepID=UPI0025D09A51|nr:hypothetical protein [Sulfurimonas sp.]MCK9455225.1 hypothetical protein [Sulfurimonas sp.]
MQNPFESGHIKNYLLFYASIVVIMVLFFIATSLFHEEAVVEQKIFEAETNSTKMIDKREQSAEEEATKTERFKLLDRAY